MNDMLDRFEPEVAAAFRAAIADWRASADIQAFVRALSNNDVMGAIASLHLDPAALQPFLDALHSAYKVTGMATIAPYPRLRSPTTGARFTVRFNGRDPMAEAYLRNNSAALVTNITNVQQEAIRIALTQGLAQGDNPTTTALEIVGRIGVNGKRQGGVIGLSSPQAQYLMSAKAELRSSDNELLRNYLNRELRDARFDGYVKRAIAAGEKIPSDIRARMLVSYSNRMLKERGNTIARTETLPVLHEAQNEAIRQTLVQTGIKSSAVTKGWKSAHDSRVRHTHQQLDGKVVKYDAPFTSPSGAKMMYPGDVSLGAPPSETIKCRCVAPMRIDFLQGVR